MLVAQISDSHVCPPGGLSNGRVDTNDFLRRAVAHLAALAEAGPAPDVVVFTGDLVETGSPDEYGMLRELLAPLTVPVYLIPGNHDDRAEIRTAFPDHDYLPREGEFLQYTVEDHPLRLIGLDTLVPGEGYGNMCDERLAWLDARLMESPESPTLVLMHHPPFLTGLSMDRKMCRNGEAVGAVIRRHPQVARVLCGHVHRYVQRAWYGTVACTSPGTAHQITLDLPAAEESGRATFNDEPPGFLLHHYRADGAEGERGVVTHYAPLGVFSGPFPFHSGG